MNRNLRHLLLAILVVLAVLFFYQIGQSSNRGEDLDQDDLNLSSFPTSTPRPQIIQFIREALRRRPRPTPPPDSSENM